MVNKAIIVGNLGKDPESRQAGESTVCNFTVATTEKYKNETHTEWHNIVVWGKLAEICQQYLTKGSKVYLEGKIQTRKWEDKNGVTKYSTEIVAREMKMLGSKADGAPAPAAAKASVPAEDEPDDLPF